MRLKSMIIALVGIGVAGGSVYMARGYIADEVAAQKAQQETGISQVYAAAREIPYGAAIEGHMVTTIPWPKDAIPQGAFTSKEMLIAGSREDARRAKNALAQGEIILASKVSGFGEKITIVQRLGDNTRAMAIQVNATTAVGGFVTPGDAVDILMTQGSGDELGTFTILQNIRVIGVDQTADQQTDKPVVARTVTVEVTPEQGQRLALAQSAGSLSLSLRSLENSEDKPLDSVRLSDLLQQKSPVEEEAVRNIVRVRRGVGDAEEVPVEVSIN